MCAHLFALNWKMYSDIIEKRWEVLPIWTRNFIVSAVLFIMGSSIRGEWLLIWIYFSKAFDSSSVNSLTPNVTLTLGSRDNWSFNLSDIHLQGLSFYWFWAMGVSFAIYMLSGGFLYWYYYLCQRQRASEWKCQPEKFPSREDLVSEILQGSFSLLMASSVTGVVACYVMNGGACTIYYRLEDYGLLWYLLSIPIVYIWQDYLTYWMHRLYHHPFLYRHFHKIHHRFKQPTAFSATAFHPVEIYSLQAILLSPMFLYPVHWSVFVGSLMYNYYHGIIDHSGINFKASWWQPWQPDTIFHDNHHQYTYVNFGVNCKYWDKIHGTARRIK